MRGTRDSEPMATQDIASQEPDESQRQWGWLAPIAIFGVALALRLAHLYEISLNDPYFTIPAVDGAVYDAWARRLAAGDFVGDRVLFMGPLYAYAMAAVYALVGPSIAAVKLLQAVLGSLSCVLVWALAREMFDRRVAAVAGYLAAFYAMSIFYGGTLMLVNVQIPLVLGLTLAWLRAMRLPSATGWALCGSLIGLSALARQTTLLLAPLALLAIFHALRDSHVLRARIGFATAFSASIALLILPFSVQNYMAAQDVVLLNSTGGPNFYMGNYRGADGAWQRPSIGSGAAINSPESMQREFGFAAEQATGRPMKASEISRFWLHRGLAEIRSDPARWIRLEVRKIRRFLSAYEVWNNRSFEVSQRFSWVVQSPLPTFGMVAPLGLLGIALSRRRARKLFPAYAVLGAYLTSALVFFVLSRYRMPAAIALLPFAAFAVVCLFDTLRQREFRALGVQVIGLAICTAFVHLPTEPENRMAMAYFNLANKYRDLERWDEAETAYRDSIRENPLSAAPHNNLAITYELSGQTDKAISTWITVGRMANKSGDRVRLERAARHLHELGVTRLPAEPPAMP